MARFSINDLLNAQSRALEGRPGIGFNISNIPLAKIRPSQANKYGVRAVEELAASIESMGLLHNIVVRAPDAEGMHEIVSGERRYRACKMLFEAGNADYATVPCKVENVEGEAVSELKLLYANATARELTDYEKTYQAQRIKELLKQLKREGHPFKGRLREIVAEMLEVSPAQVGRMESIGKNLTPELTEKFKDGEIGITRAYELSTLPKDVQAEALEGKADRLNAELRRQAKGKAAQESEPTQKEGNRERGVEQAQRRTHEDIIRSMTTVQLARFLSGWGSGTEYEQGEYDPDIMAWLQAEAVDGWPEVDA
jgi:ParB family chromosome partitioning protein